MDEIVRQAMQKWPDVPHCHGWLRLDARGVWRMRDERTRQLGLPGEPIRHPALLEFIGRNYAHDAQGRWYFQNGPQRVYVDLAMTPYVARTRPAGQEMELVLHTGETVDRIDAAWMDDSGRLYLMCEQGPAALDDRDLADLLPSLRMPAASGQDAEEALLQWLTEAQGEDEASAPVLHHREQAVRIGRLDAATLESRLRFIAMPREA